MCSKQSTEKGNYFSYNDTQPPKQIRTQRLVGHRSHQELHELQRIRCNIEVGDTTVQQDFIVCKHLRRDIILGTDFTKKNYVGVSWT